MSRMNRGERGYWAFIAHRLSGLALAAFLPIHFLTLALAIEGAERLQNAIDWFDRPAVEIMQWLLVVCLALHLSLGVRLLVVEFGAWKGPRWRLLGAGVCFSALIGALLWGLK